MTETSDMNDIGTSRRAIFAGAGAIGVAGVLAACGGGTETPTGTNPPASPTKGGAPATTGVPANTVVATKAEVPVGGGKINGEAGVVVVQPTAGQFLAYSAICTHQQCVLASVSNGTINCGCHGSQFSAADGSVKRGPAVSPLPKKQIKVEGDDIKLA